MSDDPDLPSERRAGQAAGETARLFVAALPPPEVLDAIERLPRPEVPGVRYTARDQWHVTLRFLGTSPVEEALRAFGAVVAAPAVARAGPSTARLGRYIVCLPVDGLDAVAEAVGRATAHVGRPPDARPFRGHVTLARLARTAPRRLEGLVGRPLEARFTVDEIHLVRSVTHATGAVYDSLAVHRLAGEVP